MSPDDQAHDDRKRLGPNAGYIGTAARQALNTPCLILDLDKLESNIAAMAHYAREAGVQLRPHAKCHKSSELARRQVAAGAIGACCATIGEAEILGWSGTDDILITSPVVTSAKLSRFQQLAVRVGRLAVVVDNLDNAEDLATIASAHGQTFDVVIDIDPGMQRTGVAAGDACAFVSRVAALPGLRYRGIQYYAGHLQHIDDYSERRSQSRSAIDRLRHVVADLVAQGLTPDLITGSGTGTFDIDVEEAVFTELQVGSYVFMDSQYWQVRHQSGRPVFEQSLFVQAAVCSANFSGFVTVDAGLKHFSLDAGLPEVIGAGPERGLFAFQGDEHGRVTPPAMDAPLQLGERVEFIPPHCDPTINLYNHFHCFRGERLAEIWPIDARGR